MGVPKTWGISGVSKVSIGYQWGIRGVSVGYEWGIKGINWGISGVSKVSEPPCCPP